MKKIITKISLSPLLTLFTKKKSVRKTSDIILTPPKNVKLKPIEPPVSLKWEKPTNENGKEIKGYKAERSHSYPRFSPSKMTAEQLLSYSQKVVSIIHGSSDYPVPSISMTELNSIITDFEFARLLKDEQRTPVSVDRLNKARLELINCLWVLKKQYPDQQDF